MEENTFQMVYFFFFLVSSLEWSNPLEGGESTEMERLVTITFFVGGKGHLNPRRVRSLSLGGSMFSSLARKECSMWEYEMGVRRGWQLEFEKLSCLDFF